MHKLFSRAALALIMVVAAGALHAGSVADLDRDNGLPDAKLGASLESFHGLRQIEDTGRWLTYQAPGDKLTFEGFPIAAVKYNFFKGRLYSLNLDVDEKRSVRGILKKLEADYGTTHSFEKRHIPKADTDLETREWAGQRVYLLYKSATNGAGAQIILLDRPTWDQLQIPREKRQEQFREMMSGSFSNGDL